MNILFSVSTRYSIPVCLSTRTTGHRGFFSKKQLMYSEINSVKLKEYRSGDRKIRENMLTDRGLPGAVRNTLRKYLR
jgi:hypothetical protein